MDRASDLTDAFVEVSYLPNEMLSLLIYIDSVVVVANCVILSDAGKTWQYGSQDRGFQEIVESSVEFGLV